MAYWLSGPELGLFRFRSRSMVVNLSGLAAESRLLLIWLAGRSVSPDPPKLYVKNYREVVTASEC